MKRIGNFIAVNIVAVLIGTGIPALAQDGYHSYSREDNHSRYSDSRYDRRDYEDSDRDRGDYGRGYRDDHEGAYGYAPAPVYGPEPVYAGPAYGAGYYEPRTHYGRTAAIVGGSAAAGALLGAAAGHGQGAVIGAVIGGVAGMAASAAVNHHRY